MELQLKNIGMIKEANVKLDGLTVIAGENDTGKSTVAKVLFAMLNCDDASLFSDLFKENFFLDSSRISLKTEYAKYSLVSREGVVFKTTVPLFGYKNGEKDVVFIESPLVWNFTDFFRDIAQIESQMNIKLEYPHLMKDLNFRLHIKSASDGLDIKKEMTDLMGGEFKKDELGRYYFDKQGKKIDLLNTATGIKTFGIFQVLSQNNYLNENTVLVLDEPEVHLHPKWQLEMAKVIVELVKNGVKVLVNSHSPYMIEALEVYSSKQKINSNFYLAEKKDNQSVIIDVTDNLEPIYEKLAAVIETIERESMENFKW